MAACPDCGERNPERARFCLSCAAALPSGGTVGGRRTVTILFADITGSTSLGEQLDAESLRRVMTRYFDEMRAIVERHGGTVEKFIGDEVMAVFGVPSVHEDDAVRAVRAAAEMRARLRPLNAELEEAWGARLAARTGVNTGEVVAGDPASGATFVTGEAVVVAKRLQQAAEPDEILVGDATYPLVRDAVEAQRIDGLILKGKRDPVTAWRLHAVDASAPGLSRRLDAPLVGRDDELTTLLLEFGAATRDRACRLATVLGPAGIGKSRLAAELAAAVGGRARVLSGRCLPYGEGITFWPLAEIVRDAGGDEAVARLLGREEDGDVVLERIRGALRAEGPAAQSAETFWAVRRLLEAHARTSPLLVVVDDLHWAEATFLDLLDYLAGWSRDAPVLILCLARPELLEKRPDWARASPGAPLLTLQPLTDSDSAALLTAFGGTALGERAHDRIVAAAEGNPLFLEQMLAMAADRPDAALRIPPSIHALLAARLDQLTPEQRLVLERASVIGKEFERGAVAHLCPPELRPAVGAHLLALTRKELLRPALSATDDGFAFRHLLIRDTAYAGLAKETRAALHVEFAECLESRPGGARELDEIVGYHLEEAHRYRSELSRVDDDTRRIGRAAAARLARAGARALARDDVPAAASLLERALHLDGPDAAGRPLLLVQLGGALMKQGDFAAAGTALRQASEAAAESGDRGAELRALLELEFLRSQTMPATREHERLAESLIPELTAAGDHVGLAKAWRLVSDAHVSACRWQARADALERALAHARAAAEAPQEASAVIAALAQALHYGPTPVPDAIARCREFLAECGNANRALRAALNTTLAALLAAEGAFDEARALYAESVTLYEELGLRVRRAARTLNGAEIELLAGEPAAAERELRGGYETLTEVGEQSARPVLAAYLADVLCEEGRLEEARHFARVAAELAEADDVAAQATHRSVSGRVLALSGQVGAAEDVAREAVELAAETDFPSLRAATLAGLAAVRAAAGRADEARLLLLDAAAVHAAKGNRVAAERLAGQASTGRPADLPTPTARA